MKFASLFFVCLTLIAAAFQLNKPSEKQGEAVIKNILKTELDKEFTPGREVLIDLVEIPPNTVLKRHWHPGEEFHYYMEGKVEIRIDGDSSITGVPGQVGHVPYMKPHTAIAGKEGAKILVFRVHSHGEPIRYLEDTEDEKK